MVAGRAVPRHGSCHMVMVLLCVLIASLLGSAWAGVHDLREWQLNPNEEVVLRSTMYSPDDAPASTPPGNGRSYVHVSVNVTLARAETWGGSDVDVVVYHADAASDLGRTLDGIRYVCCVPALVDFELCTMEELGNVMASQRSDDMFDHWKVALSNGSQVSGSLSQSFNVTHSGPYRVSVVNCGDGTVNTKGTVVWLNPYGYLSGELWPLLPFYEACSLALALVGVLWFIACALYWKVLLPMQLWLSVVLGLSMLECASWYELYHSFNAHGRVSSTIVIFTVVASVVKATVSRVMVLVVSMGYGIVRPTLGETRHWVTLLGVAYFVFRFGLSMAESLQRMRGQSANVIAPVLPVAMLDAIFFWCIFWSLLRTIAHLIARQQRAKLSVYRAFANVLIFLGIVSALGVLFQLMVIAGIPLDERWRYWWLNEAGWYVLYMVVLVTMLVLWRPTANNMRYAYRDDPGADDEIELGSIVSSAAATRFGHSRRVPGGVAAATSPGSAGRGDRAAEEGFGDAAVFSLVRLTEQLMAADSDEADADLAEDGDDRFGSDVTTKLE